MQLTAITALLASAAAVQGAMIQKRYDTVQNVQHTFYGYPDNSPPGASTAYDCGYGRGYTAGGKGTYDDPRTMVSQPVLTHTSPYTDIAIGHRPRRVQQVRSRLGPLHREVPRLPGHLLAVHQRLEQRPVPH